MNTNKKKDARLRELRRRGLELVAHDHFEKAAEVYLELLELEPHEGDWARRASDCYWQLKNEPARLKYCVRAAQAFCDSGFMLKAIAMCKVVLNLDPSHQATQQRLARLYAKSPGKLTAEAVTEPIKTVTVSPSRVLPDPQTLELSQQKDARRTRARLAAAAALKQIRAQRQVQQQAFLEPSEPSSKLSPVPSSRAPISLMPSPQVIAAPTTALTPVPGRPGSPPSAPRSPSLHAISLHARLPSAQRSLTPHGPQTAYSIALSEFPPPSVLAAPSHRTEGPFLQPQMLEPSMSPSRALGETDGDQLFPAPLSLTAISLPPAARLPTDALELLAVEQGTPSSFNENIILAQFEEIPLFSALNHGSLVHLIEGLELVELAPEQVLFEEGDLADSMYVVAEGRVAAEVVRADGSSLILAELKEGEFFGEIGLLSDQPRQARVRALNSSRLLRIERQVVAHLIDSDSTFLSTLVDFLHQRLVANLIQTSPLFAGLPYEERVTLAQRFEFLELEEDTALLQPGQRPHGLYVLLAGTALTYRPLSRPQLMHLGPGAIFGQQALLTNQCSEFEVRTSSKCYALCLSAKQFRELIMTHPTVLEYVSTLDNPVTVSPDLGDHVTLF